MKAFLSLTYCVLLFSASSFALTPAFPHVTPELLKPDEHGWTPKPTQAPQIDLFGELKLFNRQATATPNTTCGVYQQTDLGKYACGTSSACLINYAQSGFGCCKTNTNGQFNLTDCAHILIPYSTCIESFAAVSCDDNCRLTATVCTSSTYTYCGTEVLLQSSYTMSRYVCAAAPLLAWVVYGNGVTITTSTSSITTTLTSTSTSSTAVKTSTSVVLTGLTSSTTNQLSSSLVPASVSSFSSSTSTSQTTSSTPLPSPHNSHTAAIVGGVVGGVAGIAVIAGLTIFFLWKRKRDERRKNAVQE